MSVEICRGLRRWKRGTDLASELFSIGLNALNLWLVEDALKTLIKEGNVRAKVIKKPGGEETYYGYINFFLKNKGLIWKKNQQPKRN